jgi:hypothetical protein
MVDNIYWEIPSSVDLEGFLKKYLPANLNLQGDILE